MSSYHKLVPPDVSPETRKATKRIDLTDRLARVEKRPSIRMIAGVVSSSGVASNTKFTASRQSTGQYTINFPTNFFSSTPAIVITAGNGIGPFVGKIKDSSFPSETSVQITMFVSSAGTVADAEFNFIAMLP